MDARSRSIPPTPSEAPSQALVTRLFREGIAAGLIGGATIAVWFLFLDALAGRPLYTPSTLGLALFKGRAALLAAAPDAVSLEMVMAFSVVHWLVFAVIGSVTSWLLAFAERSPYLGLGLAMLFLLIVFEFGFLAAAVFFADALLHLLSWPAVITGNVLAAAAMMGYLWWRHPTLALQRITDTLFASDDPDA